MSTNPEDVRRSSIANTKSKLMGFDKSKIVDELHKLLNTQQIAKLINNIEQSVKNGGYSNTEAKSEEELNKEITELMDKLSIPQSARGQILKLPQQQKQELIQQYKERLNKGGLDDIAEDENDTKEDALIMPDKTQIIYEGWLHKKGKKHKSWQKRYFALYGDNILVYFEKKEDMKEKSKKQKGQISLYEVTELIKKDREDAKVGKKYKFELVTRSRTFVLKSEDPKPYQKWVKKISIRINPAILHKGWCKKQARSGKDRWSQRYFILCNYEKIWSEIRYYEDEKMKKFKGVVEIADVIKMEEYDGKDALLKFGKDHNNILELVMETETFVMSFKTIKERNEWKDEITNVKFDDDNHAHITNPAFKPKQDAEAAKKKYGKNANDDEMKLGMTDKVKVNPLHTAVESAEVENVNNGQEQPPPQQQQQPQQQQYGEEQQNEEEQPYQQEEPQQQEVQDDDDDAWLGNDSESDELPEGWYEAETEDGKKYYYNEETNETQWTKP